MRLLESALTENEQRLQAQIDVLLVKNAALEARIVELLARLNTNSTNSSKPSSTDSPFHTKPKPPQPPSGKKPGGQIGHKPHNREMLEPTPGEIYSCPLAQCQHCKADLDDSTVLPGKQSVHQVVEVVSQAVVKNYITEQHKCGKCGKKSRAPLPPGVPPTAAGPHLQAIITALIGKYNLSRVDTKDAISQMFGVDLSVGAIHNVTPRAAQAVAPAMEEVLQALIAAATKHCDETGWRHCDKLAWLWVVTNPTIGAYFHIDQRRTREAFAKLLPELLGVIHTDRWSVYDIIDAILHQLCHAHLRRDIQALVDLKDSAGAIGAEFLKASDAMFKIWHRFKNGVIDRAQMVLDMVPVQADWRELAKIATHHEHKKVKALGKDLIKQWDSLWPFLQHDGAEPTNNHAERIVRPGVILRKTNGGTGCDSGADFVAKMQGVIATAKCHGVKLVGWLTAAFEAYWDSARPQPMLLPRASG